LICFVQGVLPSINADEQVTKRLQSYGICISFSANDLTAIRNCAKFAGSGRSGGAQYVRRPMHPVISPRWELGSTAFGKNGKRE